jgi:hypothetical protein
MTLAFTTRSLARFTPSCDASGGSFQCELTKLLHFLYAIAGMLAVLLLIVILAAFFFYRKNRSSKGEDNPDE